MLLKLDPSVIPGLSLGRLDGVPLALAVVAAKDCPGDDEATDRAHRSPNEERDCLRSAWICDRCQYFHGNPRTRRIELLRLMQQNDTRRWYVRRIHKNSTEVHKGRGYLIRDTEQA